MICRRLMTTLSSSLSTELCVVTDANIRLTVITEKCPRLTCGINIVISQTKTSVQNNGPMVLHNAYRYIYHRPGLFWMLGLFCPLYAQCTLSWNGSSKGHWDGIM